MARPRQAHGLRSKVYTPVLLELFRSKYRPGDSEVSFTLEEVRAEVQRQGLEVRNAADIIYRMKSRTILPEEIRNNGFHILAITGRGRYALRVGDTTLIDYPDDDVFYEVVDRTPPQVRALLDADFGSLDEQGLLSVLRYNDLFSDFLGVRTFHLKGHVRRSVPGVGQAEVDDVHVAVVGIAEGEGQTFVVPVEAKAKDDPVNRVQIAMQIRYAHHSFPGLPVRPLTVKLFPDGLVLFIEFNPTTEPNDLEISRYRYYRVVDASPGPDESSIRADESHRRSEF